MIKFKVCPRCNGDLYLNEDMFGRYMNCLQCGYMKDVIPPAAANEKTVDKPAAARRTVAV